MRRSLLRPIFVGLFALSAGACALRAGAAPMSMGLQYDEINRIVLAPATAPPPGSFAADYAAIESPPPDNQPKKKHGLLGAIMSGNLGDVVGDQASNAIARSLGGAFAGLSQGRIERYSFYNNWERIDDVMGKTATIRKCDLHQLIMLNLDKKTYSIVDTTPRVADASSTPMPPPPHHSPPAVEQSAPGTATLVLSQTVRALGAVLIDGLNTLHFQSTSSMTITQATGSCRDGSFSVTRDEYLSGFAEQHPICPVDFHAPAATQYPREPSQMVARGGCRPTITAHSGGPPEPAGKLALYSLMTMGGSVPGGSASPSPASPGAQSISYAFLTERGNVHALGTVDRTLFDIPSDFTKVP